MNKKDKYVHGMDWGNGNSSLSDLTNYREYQYDLIDKYIGKNVLEVGSGDRGFTNQIIMNNPELTALLSIEPSKTLFDLYKEKYKFPEFVQFENIDLFDLKPNNGLFDTAVFIHVLEHIKNDKAALDHTYNLVKTGGYVLIEVPALPCLFSVHDQTLGHYRRYNKKMLKRIIDPNKYEIKKIWYQDPIGVLGSFYFFKLRKIKIKSDEGENLVSSQGGIYDKLIIPFEKAIERLITFPFGLNLTAILKKK